MDGFLPFVLICKQASADCREETGGSQQSEWSYAPRSRSAAK